MCAQAFGLPTNSAEEAINSRKRDIAITIELSSFVKLLVNVCSYKIGLEVLLFTPPIPTLDAFKEPFNVFGVGHETSLYRFADIQNVGNILVVIKVVQRSGYATSRPRLVFKDFRVAKLYCCIDSIGVRFPVR